MFESKLHIKTSQIYSSTFLEGQWVIIYVQVLQTARNGFTQILIPNHITSSLIIACGRQRVPSCSSLRAPNAIKAHIKSKTSKMVLFAPETNNNSEVFEMKIKISNFLRSRSSWIQVHPHSWSKFVLKSTTDEFFNLQHWLDTRVPPTRTKPAKNGG